MDILKYNCITDKELVEPRYDLSEYPYKIRVRFERTGNVFIFGMVNDYVYWASYTNVADKEINAAIFDQITHKDLSKTTHEYNIVPKFDIDYSDYEYFLSVEIVPRKDGGFDTTFGHGYLADDVQCGKWFADDLDRYLERMRELCKTREMDGLYAGMLNKYLERLKKYNGYNYGDESDIREIINSEKYLAVSDNETIRNLYIECARRLSSIYREYMSMNH